MDLISSLLNQAKSYTHELPPFYPFKEIPQGRAMASWIDHTLLKPEATTAQITQLCEEARDYLFASVCVNPAFIPLAVRLLSGTPVKVGAVVGFPLGTTQSTVKVFETLTCLNSGAIEIDMVIHVGALKAQSYGQVFNEIQAISQVTHNQGGLIKVILEMALLTREEKIIACLISQAAGADFVKTSTGFGPSGATLEDVDLMRRVVGAGTGVKAAGGIRTFSDTLAMIQSGANRIGTSSGVKIIQTAVSDGCGTK